MIVCVCRRVSEKEIALHASEGVATQCGRCEDCARDVIDKCHAQASIAQHGWMPIAANMSR
jgi:bacterioferritin-associated ferredoxin